VVLGGILDPGPQHLAIPRIDPLEGAAPVVAVRKDEGLGLDLRRGSA